MSDSDKPKVDAIMYPDGWLPDVPGARSRPRWDTLFDYCSAVLGGKPHFVPAPPGWLVSRRAADHVNHDSSHGLAGQPRFDWADQPNGCQFGTRREES